jgi:hypothetical protein
VVGRAPALRGAALTRVSRPDGISLYHVLLTGKREKRAAPKNHSAMIDPASLPDRPVEQRNAGSFAGAACFSNPFWPEMPQSKCVSSWARVKAAPLQACGRSRWPPGSLLELLEFL